MLLFWIPCPALVGILISLWTWTPLLLPSGNVWLSHPQESTRFCFLARVTGHLFLFGRWVCIPAGGNGFSRIIENGEKIFCLPFILFCTWETESQRREIIFSKAGTELSWELRSPGTQVLFHSPRPHRFCARAIYPAKCLLLSSRLRQWTASWRLMALVICCPRGQSILLYGSR